MKNLHLLHLPHPPKLTESRSSFEIGCTFVTFFLHPICTFCTLCPRWRESLLLSAGPGCYAVGVEWIILVDWARCTRVLVSRIAWDLWWVSRVGTCVEAVSIWWEAALDYSLRSE